MKRFLVLILTLAFIMTPLTCFAEITPSVYDVGLKCVYENDDTSLPYRLFLPKDYDMTKEYPLLVFFHGAGERGNDNELQLFHCAQYIYDHVPEDCFIIAPQCPLNNQWVDTPWAKGAYSVDKVPESNELKAVVELVGQMQQTYPIDTDRIYASGLSMGGFATWDIIMRHSDIFAAAIAVCGGGDVSKGELLKDVPLFIFHGNADTQVPVSGSRDTVQAIKDAGGTVVEYTEYEGAGHGVWNQAFATEGVLDKLFSCKLSERYLDKEESQEPSSQEPSSQEPSSQEPSTQETTTSEATQESSEAQPEENGFWNLITITIAICIIIALAVLVVVFIRKK